MPAPQQFTDPGTSGIGLYYVPQGDSPNIAAEFLANYMRTRLPTAQAVFQARLNAAGDNGRYKQIADLVKARNDLLEQLATDRRTAARIAADQGIEASRALQTMVNARVNERGQDVDMAVARTAQQTALVQARQVRSAAAKDIVADVKQATNDYAAMLSRGAPPEQTLEAYRQRLAGAQEAMNRAQLEGGERDAIRDQLSTLEVPIGGGAGGALRSMLADHFPPSAAPEITAYGPGRRADLDALGQAAIGFAQGARAGGPPSPSSRAGAGSSSPGSAGEGPEYATQLRRIDELIAELQAQDPFERLGGFFDPLPTGRQRKVPTVGTRALAAPPPPPVAKPAPADEIAKELLPSRAPTSPRSDAAATVAKKAPAKSPAEGPSPDQADRLRESIRSAVAQGRQIDTRETIDAAEPSSMRNPLLDELLYNGVQRDPNLEHNTPRGFSQQPPAEPGFLERLPSGIDEATYNDMVTGILDDLNEREEKRKASASRRR